MNLLILGGTVFLGRHLIAAAQASGHTITTFNRGTNQLPEQAGVEKIVGDRTQSLDRLCGRKWDVVIDTCGYTPQVVSASAQALADSVGSYFFISSISAYQDFRALGQDEHAPMRRTPADGKDDYGSLKAASENAAVDVFGNRAVIIRPGLIVGPHDPTDRFTYWPSRIAGGGSVLAPGDPERQIQFIDVRDLAEWIIRLATTSTGGAYNATGPNYPFSMSAFLRACEVTLNSTAKLVWVPDKELEAAGVDAFTELPFWIPESDEDFRGFMSVDCHRAQSAGLTYRPINDTIRDTFEWDASRDPTAARKAGLTADREQQLLSANSLKPAD